MAGTEIRIRSRAVPEIRIRTRQRPLEDVDQRRLARYGDPALPVWDIRARTPSGLFTGDRMTHAATPGEATILFEQANPEYKVLTISL